MAPTRGRLLWCGGGDEMKKRTGKAAAPVEPVDPRFARVVAAFAADAELAAVADEYAASLVAGGRKKFGSRALKVGGKIFAMMAQGRFVVKLPAAKVDAMVAAKQGTYFDPGHGRKMKEWLSVTSPKLSWTALARQAYAYVAGG
jgi:hypothetical protein